MKCGGKMGEHNIVCLSEVCPSPSIPRFGLLPLPLWLQCIKSCVIQIALWGETSDDKIVSCSCFGKQAIHSLETGCIVHTRTYITSQKPAVMASRLGNMIAKSCYLSAQGLTLCVWGVHVQWAVIIQYKLSHLFRGKAHEITSPCYGEGHINTKSFWGKITSHIIISLSNILYN